PEAVWRYHFRGSTDQICHFFGGRDAGRVDVPNTGADLVRVLKAGERPEQFHVGARGLNGDHVCVQLGDGVDDVVELAVTHVRVDLRFVSDAGRTQPKSIDSPAQILRPFRSAQRKSFAKSGFVYLDDAETCGFEIGNFIADRQRNLAGGFTPR